MPKRLKIHGKGNKGEHGKIKAHANGNAIPAAKREKKLKASKKRIPGCGTLLLIVTALIILIVVIV